MLCGARPAVIGYFTPAREVQQALGVPATKTRLIIYALCTRCVQHPEAAKEVERRYMAELPS